MNNTKKNVKIICYDNVGEKNTLKENCAKNSEDIKFEFTSPGTPQKNGVVEQGFATLYASMHTMMEHAELNEKLKTVLWPKCAATATKLENIMVNPPKENAHMRSSLEKYQTTHNNQGILDKWEFYAVSLL